MSARLFGGALLVALVFAPPAAAGVTKQTFRVPVSAPDEHGAKVALDTDVYMPAGRAPPAGRPFVVVFHGGGSNKDSGFDAGHAKAFAEHGYVSLLYSQRGHGSSSGQTAVAGPKEMRDVFDVIHWALARPAFHVDRMRIGLTGYSQGGLHTNLAQVWASDRRYNPYGIRFRALEPADTPDRVFEALDTHDVVKLSFGVALLETYLVGTHAQTAPVVGKWIGVVAADQPQLLAGDVCQDDVHDTSTSSIKADLAFRSVGCHDSRMKPPIMWAQAFDDTLFTADMAISMYERMPSRDKRLYLDMAGHAAPAASDAELASKLRDQIAFMDHALRGRRLRSPRVVWWTRDGAVAVPGGAYKYPDAAWFRQSAKRWPPPGTRNRVFTLGSGSTPLVPLAEDERNDPVALAAFSASPMGTSVLPGSLPATDLPGAVAAYRSEPFAAGTELAGSPVASLAWTPAGPDTQLVVKLYDQAPDGGLQLITRGVQGMRGAPAGQPLRVEVRDQAFSWLLRPGHRLLAWVMAGDAGFYKPYAGQAGGLLDLAASTLSVPLRPRPTR